LSRHIKRERGGQGESTYKGAQGWLKEILVAVTCGHERNIIKGEGEEGRSRLRNLIDNRV